MIVILVLNGVLEELISHHKLGTQTGATTTIAIVDCKDRISVAG